MASSWLFGRPEYQNWTGLWPDGRRYSERRAIRLDWKKNQQYYVAQIAEQTT